MKRESMPEINKTKKQETSGKWYGGEKEQESDLKIVNIPIHQIKKAGYNPRIISEYQLEALKKSIHTWGFLQPILVNKKTMQIVAGHQRLEAYKVLNRSTIPAILIDKLTPEKEKALNIALNRIGGQFDTKTLAEIIKDMTPEDQALTWLESADIELLLKELGQDAPKPNNSGVSGTLAGHVEIKDDNKEMPKLYELGKHRLLYGDSTNPEHYKILMQGNKCDLVITDPPFNIAYQNSKGEEILNDNLDKRSFQIFLDAVFENVTKNAKETAAYYICFGYQTIELLKKTLARLNMVINSYIIWHKDKQTFGLNAHYMHIYELIVYCNKAKQNPYFSPLIDVENKVKDISKKKNVMDVWKVDGVENKKRIHINEKPVELIIPAIENSSRRGEIVLDCFAGSGSALEACHRTGRIFYGIEMDRKNVELIIKRWEKLDRGGNNEHRKDNRRTDKTSSGRTNKTDKKPKTDRECHSGGTKSGSSTNNSKNRSGDSKNGR